MADDARDPTAHAADIDAARERLISFISSCGNEEWRAAPLDGDPRPVAVVVDHVAHAYEYLAGWISQLVAGQPAEVNSEIVDALNAQYARAAAARHADDHRTDLQAALTARGTRRTLHPGCARRTFPSGPGAEALSDPLLSGGTVRSFCGSFYLD